MIGLPAAPPTYEGADKTSFNCPRCRIVGFSRIAFGSSKTNGAEKVFAYAATTASTMSPPPRRIARRKFAASDFGGVSVRDVARVFAIQYSAASVGMPAGPGKAH